MDFANLVTKGISLLICGDIVDGAVPVKHRSRVSRAQKAHSWLMRHRVKAFYQSLEAREFDQGEWVQLKGGSIMNKLRDKFLNTSFNFYRS